MVVRSNKGFYVGDVSYVLSDDVYQNFWETKKNGYFTVNPVMNLAFAVTSTAYGDGVFYDDDNNRYLVDAGNIGLVPLELAEKEQGLRLGQVFLTPGAATFHWFDGVFTLGLPKDRLIRIDTR